MKLCSSSYFQTKAILLMTESTLQYEDPEDENNAIEITGGSFCWTERPEEAEISASRENLDEVGTENSKGVKDAAEKLLDQSTTKKHTYLLKDIDLSVPKVNVNDITNLKSRLEVCLRVVFN